MLATTLLLAAALGTAPSPRDGVYVRGGHRYQTIWVTGSRGSACTLVRGGRTIARLTLGTADTIAEVDVTKSHAPIVLTCAGVSKKLAWGKQPCGPEACVVEPPHYPAAVPMFH